MTPEQRRMISALRSEGAGFVNVGLRRRTTFRSGNRWRNRSANSSQKTSPRGLEMSTMPTVPTKWAGRAADRLAIGSFSSVGSRISRLSE